MRTRVLRALSVVFALTWLVVPGFGVADLVASWHSDWPVALEAGWGLLAILLVAVPLLLLGFVPRLEAVARFELGLAVVTMTLAAVATVQWWLLAFAAGAVLEAYVLLRVGRRWRVARPAGRLAAPRPRVVGVVPMLVALLGVGPWLAYAVHMVLESYDDKAVHDVTMGIDHYAMQAALAASVLVLGLLAVALPVANRLMGWTAGLVALCLGALSVIRPDEPGGLGRAGGALAVLWGATVWVIVATRGAEIATLVPPEAVSSLPEHRTWDLAGG